MPQTARLKIPVGRIDAAELTVESLPFLSPEECAQARDLIFDLRPAWTHRHAAAPFYTLGTASYLDASKGRLEHYRERARETNPPLAGSFSWLYERLAGLLAEYSGERCLYDPELAYPGFHIFLGHDGADSSASMHYDLQCDNLDWSSYGWMDRSQQLSFTLALRLPSTGGGMYVWNLNDELLSRMEPEERRRCVQENREPSYYRYTPGEVVVHSGHYLHQIARVRKMEPGEERITLQGHAALTDRGWVLYW